MRLWSLGQQRCITTYRIHGEGVWALCANENFTGFYSSGRDKNVMWTDLNMDDSSTLLFVEDAPVLNVSQLIKLVAILVQKSRTFCQMTDLLIALTYHHHFKSWSQLLYLC